MKYFKLFFAAVLAVCMSACDGCGGGGSEELSGYIKKNAKGFKASYDAEMEQYGNVQMIDCRTAAEYAEGHIPGAINIDGTNPASYNGDNSEFMKAAKAAFVKERKIFLYSTKGYNAIGMTLPGRVANYWGKQKTINLETGYDEWVEAGYEVEK